MLKSLRLGLVALAAIGTLASCNNDADAEVREEAREALETTDAAAVTGADGAAAVATPAVPTGPLTEISFAESEFDFGTVAEGERVKHVYTFKNTGDEPLVLSNAVGSCGCTVPQWPREPIAPGASGEIEVEFNSQGKAGDRNQKVTITANTDPAQTIIALKGKVEPAAQPAG